MSASASQAASKASLLLLNNILTIQPGASPFSLVQDTVEQSARPLLRQVITGALHTKPSSYVLYITFEFLPKYLAALQKGNDIQIIKGNRETPLDILQDIQSAIASRALQGKSRVATKTLIMMDTIHPLISQGPDFNISYFLSSLLSMTPGTSLFVVHHTDVPLPRCPIGYTPSPLVLLKYLATTIITTYAISHVLAEKRARDRSLEEPSFGLGEEKEGILAAMSRSMHDIGMVLEVEHRRKSGRSGSGGWFYLPSRSMQRKQGSQNQLCLLRDHLLFSSDPSRVVAQNGNDANKSTFDLALTDKQRMDREGVVLPYFDAQQGKGGAGEGGRILYDMGVEDDFDEEEDEI